MKKPIKLKLQKTVNIKPKAPFDFDSTFHKPDHFTSGDNLWKKGIKWQTWNWQKTSLGIKFINKGIKPKPLIEIKIYSKNKLDKEFVSSLIDEIKYRYNFDLNLIGFYKEFKNDKILNPIIKKWKGMRPGHPSSLYEYLIIGIVLQNATVRRSVQMFENLLVTHGKVLEFDNKKLLCFWNEGGLKNINEQELRDLKVGYRAKSIKKIDEQFEKRLISEINLRQQQNWEVIKDELLKLYGVGPATVWYLSGDVFHRWEIFHHVSPWEQKIYSKLFFNKNIEKEEVVSVKKLLKYFERFGEWKQIAVHYIWEDLWWKRKNEHIPWLEKEIRL